MTSRQHGVLEGKSGHFASGVQGRQLCHTESEKFVIARIVNEMSSNGNEKEAQRERDERQVVRDRSGAGRDDNANDERTSGDRSESEDRGKSQTDSELFNGLTQEEEFLDSLFNEDDKPAVRSTSYDDKPCVPEAAHDRNESAITAVDEFDENVS